VELGIAGVGGCKGRRNSQEREIAEGVNCQTLCSANQRGRSGL
jgi:hypothetical protein